MDKNTEHIHTDALIIGGGVAGLWIANRLKNAGYDVALLESHALGSQQTLASQGMIHGGMKYTLSGMLNTASETLADMPRYWRQCLVGEGDVDLTNTRLMSDFFYLWSGNSLSDKLTSFFASKTLTGRIEPVKLERLPPLFRHSDFEGHLYRLEDIVIDTHSLVTNLEQQLQHRCFLWDWSKARWEKADDNAHIVLELDEKTVHLHAQEIVLAAGAGNGEMLAKLGIDAPKMQLRPLRQVMAKHYYPYQFYGHCIGASSQPRLTISTHKLESGESIWYFGGQLAEEGVGLAPEVLIARAQQELADVMPWVELKDAEWACVAIDRAEPAQPDNKRPDQAYLGQVDGLNNMSVAWPTKLTLTPNLGNQVLDRLTTKKIQPVYKGATRIENYCAKAPIGHPPWERAFPPKRSAEDTLAMKFPENPFYESADESDD